MASLDLIDRLIDRLINYISAHSNTIDMTFGYSTNSNSSDSEDIKFCIFAKQIIIEPSNIIYSGYLLINDKNIISNIGKITSEINELYNKSNCNIIECDILCPGLIDIHTHGIGGADNVVWYYKNPQYTASRLPMFGTTSFLATVVFSNENMDNVISMCSNQLSAFINNYNTHNCTNYKGAICEGIHCEGPIIADYGGLPDSSNTNAWNMQQFEAFIDALNNGGMYKNVKIMTISPSIDYKDNFERIKVLQQKGIIAALGHDKQCNEAEILGALSLFDDLHMTHCFNVQSFHHRNVGLANFALTPTLPKLVKYKNISKMPSIELIGDLCHISPILIEAILKCHSPNNLDRIVFITDGIAEPVSNKELFYENRCIHVDKHGKTVKNEDNILCGSCCDMLTIFKSLVNIFNIEIDKAIGMTSTNAAKILKLQHKIGSLRVGTRADMILLDGKLNLLTTIVNGDIVYNKNNS